MKFSKKIRYAFETFSYNLTKLGYIMQCIIVVVHRKFILCNILLHKPNWDTLCNALLKFAYKMYFTYLHKSEWDTLYNALLKFAYKIYFT